MTATEQDLGEYDYIVVGGGSAGCVLANRLSANPNVRVLLLESGGTDNWIWFHVPVGYLFAIGNPRADWMFTTGAEARLNGRILPYPRGRVLGGSSAINAMIYMRGQAADYDGWRARGLTGWGWADVLPYFLRHEDHVDGASAFHATGGEWRVEHPRVHWSILDSIRDACAQVGIESVHDFNTGDNAGCAYFEVNQKNGLRWSAARGFLRPVRRRSNLRIVTAFDVESVGMEGRRANAVHGYRAGLPCRARCRGEVVLTAGAIGTPLILEASGIGDAERLKAAGGDVVCDLPGVGENLQDHLQIRPHYAVSGVRTLNGLYHSLPRRGLMGVEYLLRRTGPLTMAPSQLGAFARSAPEVSRADLQFHFQPLSLPKWGEPPHRFEAFTASVCHLRPTSRGSVHLAADATGPARAIIRPNYLSSDEDREVAVRAMRLVRRIVAQPALAGFRPEEQAPGMAVQSDAELLAAAAELGTTIFHPVGTARMGAEGDRLSVLDGRLRVRGIDGLRVADASVMPDIVSGNTNSPVMMIAEKASALLLEDQRR